MAACAGSPSHADRPGAPRPPPPSAAHPHATPPRRTLCPGRIFCAPRRPGAGRQQLPQANSPIETRRTILIRARARVRDLSDQIKRLMNDPEFPVASNGNPGSCQMNRRVEIVVSNGDAAIPARSGSPGRPDMPFLFEPTPHGPCARGAAAARGSLAPHPRGRLPNS